MIGLCFGLDVFYCVGGVGDRYNMQVDCVIVFDFFVDLCQIVIDGWVVVLGVKLDGLFVGFCLNLLLVVVGINCQWLEQQQVQIEVVIM